ncbi:hypothetical protein D3C81_1749420 [compost metagenome]
MTGHALYLQVWHCIHQARLQLLEERVACIQRDQLQELAQVTLALQVGDHFSVQALG